ncbi:hypothetical protein BC938DRAFT_476182 [Jimgerdemannia flammicorona]|uniref:Uncharacterized protein n=1 Tax=Jimgerdemannia flammicorona TaxID=994334 RepID=A0A433PJL2_9FUNG|nr:hypothetical protein BC938DRAFT_476182 [Jimgerdemannia flammicorona]
MVNDLPKTLRHLDYWKRDSLTWSVKSYETYYYEQDPGSAVTAVRTSLLGELRILEAHYAESTNYGMRIADLKTKLDKIHKKTAPPPATVKKVVKKAVPPPTTVKKALLNKTAQQSTAFKTPLNSTVKPVTVKKATLKKTAQLSAVLKTPRKFTVKAYRSPSRRIVDIPSFDDGEEADSFTGIAPVDCPVIINDAVRLQLGPLPRKESRWIVNNVDVSEKWHFFKEESLKLSNGGGLFVESHVQQILSLSHILLLKPKQHCPLMVEVFGAELLGAMHNDIMQRLTEQELEFDAEVAIKLTCTIKHLQREEITRDIAVSELQSLMTGRAYEECAILKAIKNIIERVPRATLKSPVGEVELCTTYIDPVLSPIIADPERGVFLRW